MDRTREIGTGSNQSWRGRTRAMGRTAGGRFAVVGVWVLVVVVFGALRPSEFLTTSNFTSMFSTQAPLVILSLSLVVTLTVGEFDLSIAGSFGLAATLTAQLNAVDHVNWILAVILGLAATCGAGAVTALLVVGIGVDSVVATLGMGTLLIGIAEGLSNQATIGGISQQISTVMIKTVGGLSLAFYYALICALVIWYVVEYTRVGRHMLFVGHGREVARLSGVRVGRVRAGAFVVGALLAGMAGEVTLGTSGGFQASTAGTVLLPAFAGAFLGTAVVQPGRFNAWGTWIAIYFLITGITGLEILGLNAWVSDVFYGAAVVLAIGLSTVVRKVVMRKGKVAG